MRGKAKARAAKIEIFDFKRGGTMRGTAAVAASDLPEGAALRARLR